MAVVLNEVDRVEVLTLQDNYVDLVSGDGTEVVVRARPLRGLDFAKSILAEHGFSALVTLWEGEVARSILFDTGFSEYGAALNADALEADLTAAEAVVFSHGHLDHVGGLEALAGRIGRKGLEIVLHPAAFRTPRYIKVTEEVKVYLPPLTREKIREIGAVAVETAEPYPLLDGRLLFLGEIPRETDFEMGMPNAFYEEDGEEKWDPIEDDTAIAANVRGRGLVVLSGCAHSGIVNTVNYARRLTGVDRVFAVMGGFHLTGPAFEPIIEVTAEALKEIDPRYVVPTHCTGRKAINHMEREMPERFLLNMSGTRMVFSK